MSKKLIASLAVGALALSLVACSDGSTTSGGSGGAKAAEGEGNIGIAMPSRNLERWIRDGDGLQKDLEAEGYTVDLQYANDKVDQQISQIQNMIANGANVLVIASIDGEALVPVLEQAAKQNITVIAYDRLINGTENVDYYATFDNYKVGSMQGEYIEKQLGLADGKGPFNFELFAGSPDDNNARFFFNGAWDVLKPYVEGGQLVVPSGKTNYDNIGILEWKSSTAQSEMDNRLQSFYSDGKSLDVVLAPNDSLAVGIEASLKSNGFKPDTKWPLITGQDADLANIKAVLSGEQSMSVWKDTRQLGGQVAKMVKQVLEGKTVEVNDTKTYDNGKKVVPSFLLEPTVITADNVETELVESEFYTKDQLGL